MKNIIDKKLVDKKLLDKKLLFETIKVEEGKLFNIFWHNQRFNRTRKALFKTSKELDLQTYLTPPTKGVYRCKVTYNNAIQSIEYFPYQAKKFHHFKIVKSNIAYPYKYFDRSGINDLLDANHLNTNHDEIVIEKDGLLTDTSIANIAFYDGHTWLTPATPLLEGTTRARLLDEGFLKLHNIRKEEIQNYSHFALMNAMLGFQIQKSVCLRM